MKTIERKLETALSLQTEPANAKTLARLTRCNYSSVRVTLRRMLEDGTAMQNDAGFYYSAMALVTETGLLRERLEMHGIQIQATCNNDQASLSLMVARDVTTGGHRHPVNHGLTHCEEWMGRSVSTTHHEAAGKVCVSLMSGDDSLNFHEFQAFASWLMGRFPDILLADWEVTQLGINWDTYKLGLDGVKKVSLQLFKDLWFNIYERHDGRVRVEAHTTSKMDLSELLEVMSLFVKVVQPPELVVR